jgi:magnesium-transporting ATPase (P-type)
VGWAQRPAGQSFVRSPGRRVAARQGRNLRTAPSALATASSAETPPQGLSGAEVAERRSRGLGNTGGEPVSRPVAEILRGNILTRFNFILGVLLAVILAVGEPQDAVFGIVLVANALIGIGQELRAKLTLDRLAVLSAPRVRVIRDGAPQEMAAGELVAGDLVDVRPGDQLVADGVVRDSMSLQADESLLTGESEPVDKRVGERLLSGSFVVAGAGSYQATGVGEQAYARELTAQARRFTLVRSELMAGINRILRYITWAIVPVGLLLVVSQLHARDSVREALTGTVAALVGMVPQGLVLLTSIAFGVAALTLARRKVLVQQLPAVEGLARVDVMCFDKTGALTDGTITFSELISLDNTAPAGAALGALAADEARNATLEAIGQAFPAPGWSREAAVICSSSPTRRLRQQSPATDATDDGRHTHHGGHPQGPESPATEHIGGPVHAEVHTGDPHRRGQRRCRRPGCHPDGPGADPGSAQPCGDAAYGGSRRGVTRREAIPLGRRYGLDQRRAGQPQHRLDHHREPDDPSDRDS